MPEAGNTFIASGKIPCVSRADLVRHLDVFGADKIERLSEFSGFELKKKKSENVNVDFKPFASTGTSFSESTLYVEVEESTPLVSFIRVVSHEKISEQDRRNEEPDWFKETEELDASFHNEIASIRPKPPELSPWSRLGPFIKCILSVLSGSTQIDEKKAVDHIANGKSISEIPFRKKKVWAPVCQIILDFNDRIIPFRKDLRAVGHHLEHIRGKFGLDIIIPERGPSGKFRKLSANYQPLRAYRFPEPETPIFIISDLGCYDETGAASAEWSRFGNRLIKAGFKPVVLAPVPKKLVKKNLRKFFQIVTWDRDTIFPRNTVSGKTAFNRAAYSKSVELSAMKESVRTLLALLSPAIRIEPDLLRAARVLLPHGEVNVGTEALAWLDESVESSMIAFTYEHEVVEDYRGVFREMDRSLQNRVASIIATYHANLDPVIANEEALNLKLLAGIENFGAISFVRKATKTFIESEGTYPYKRELAAYINRLGNRQHMSVWKDSDEVATLWASANKDAIIKDEIELPEGFDISRVAWIFERKAEPVRLTIRQKGTSLILDRQGWDYRNNDVPFEENGSPVATIFSGMESIQVFEKAQDIKKRPYLLKEKDFSLPVSLSGNSEIEITTDFDRIKLDYITCPDWAKGIGRDHKGLFVILHDGRKAYWTNPSKYVLRHYIRPIGLIEFEKGFWWDEAEHDYWFYNYLDMASWADDIGIDAYGLYADVNIKGVSQRFRWIKPGSFMMGTPETEPERLDNEKQHEVILTKAFWMADAACTQALWLAVMGKKTSNFEGDNSPVENISWDDAIKFIKKLNSIKPELKLRLPTEAEWEYSCRAGTDTPFAFGENITTDQVNFDGVYLYNGAQKGLSRRNTVDVKSLPCNEWGLYEMHGNVWEWCDDWYGDYPGGASTDPEGPKTGDYHVLRGGSWLYDARYARSADRRGNVPVFRPVNIGFRLARGQV